MGGGYGQTSHGGLLGRAPRGGGGGGVGGQGAEPFRAWTDRLRKRAPPEWKEPLPPTTGHMPFPTSEESIAALVDRAWRYLLENQPHDSICGCSGDGVHDEMRQRDDWVGAGGGGGGGGCTGRPAGDDRGVQSAPAAGDWVCDGRGAVVGRPTCGRRRGWR